MSLPDTACWYKQWTPPLFLENATPPPRDCGEMIDGKYVHEPYTDASGKIQPNFVYSPLHPWGMYEWDPLLNVVSAIASAPACRSVHPFEYLCQVKNVGVTAPTYYIHLEYMAHALGCETNVLEEYLRYKCMLVFRGGRPAYTRYTHIFYLPVKSISSYLRMTHGDATACANLFYDDCESIKHHEELENLRTRIHVDMSMCKKCRNVKVDRCIEKIPAPVSIDDETTLIYWSYYIVDTDPLFRHYGMTGDVFEEILNSYGMRVRQRNVVTGKWIVMEMEPCAPPVEFKDNFIFSAYEGKWTVRREFG
jgi:hypothetical protein